MKKKTWFSLLLVVACVLALASTVQASPAIQQASTSTSLSSTITTALLTITSTSTSVQTWLSQSTVTVSEVHSISTTVQTVSLTTSAVTTFTQQIPQTSTLQIPVISVLQSVSQNNAAWYTTTPDTNTLWEYLGVAAAVVTALGLAAFAVHQLARRQQQPEITPEFAQFPVGSTMVPLTATPCRNCGTAQSALANVCNRCGATLHSTPTI